MGAHQAVARVGAVARTEQRPERYLACRRSRCVGPTGEPVASVMVIQGRDADIWSIDVPGGHELTVAHAQLHVSPGHDRSGRVY